MALSGAVNIYGHVCIAHIFSIEDRHKVIFEREYCVQFLACHACHFTALHLFPLFPLFPITTITGRTPRMRAGMLSTYGPFP